MHAEGFEVIGAALPDGVNGSTDFATRAVAVARQLPDAQAAKTLAHELGHVLLHDGTEYAAAFFGVPTRTSGSGGGTCRGLAELEAESGVYIAGQAAGLTTAAYSFGYVARCCTPTKPEVAPGTPLVRGGKRHRPGQDDRRTGCDLRSGDRGADCLSRRDRPWALAA